MSRLLDRTNVAVAALDGADCDGLAQSLREARCTVETCESADALVSRATAGDVHAVVLATGRPEDLPKSVVRTLLSVQADISVTFLVPDRAACWESPALRGATLDQVHELALPGNELVELLRTEVASVLVSRPEYLIVCVDDDPDFLGSLEGLLPARLERACPQWRLRFEFCPSPADALALVQSSGGAELALIISDQVMPEMKGVDLLARVKVTCPHAQRVLLTGYAGLDSAIVAINEQVLDKYLTKPIEQPVDFVNTLQHLLREYHLNRSRSTERHRLLAQFELIRALSLARNTPRTIEAVDLCLAEQLAPSRRWAVLLPDGDDLRVQRTSRPPPGLESDQRVSAADGLPGWVLRSHRPVFALRDRDLPADVQSPVPAPLVAVPLLSGGVAIGLILVSSSADAPPISRPERVLLSFVADAAAVAVAGLQDRQALQNYYVATMASLMEAVEAKDVYTRGHTDRVCEVALALGRALGMGEPHLKDLEYAALLHDIGKIAVPDAIIDKPARLTPEEYAVMKQHSASGDRILRHLRFLDRARLILRGHHERYDGRGYPDGLMAEEIPMGARILAIADSYDAMTSARPYRDAMSPEAALAEVERNAGQQFDAALVVEFAALMRRGPRRSDLASQEKDRQEIER